jgi:hypothetical protein
MLPPFVGVFTNKFFLFFLLVFSFNNFSAQVHDNGIGGYGYIEYDLVHNSKLQGNWIYGGGGLIVNKVYFAGLYYGSQTNAFTNLSLAYQSPLIQLTKDSDTNVSLFNITASDIGGQFGGIFWAEKTLQLSVSARAGFFLSSLNETFNDLLQYVPTTTHPFLTLTPEIKGSFMPIKLMKMQVGIGYKYVNYEDSRLKENGLIGNRNNMFNSFYWSFSLLFGSF